MSRLSLFYAWLMLLCALPCYAQVTLRSQTFLVSSSEINNQASQFFDEIRSRAIAQGRLVESGERHDRIKRIAGHIIDAAREYRSESASWAWEVILVDEDIKNAYCLPGGKITLYTGLIDSLALGDDELAAVIGHEVAHALREHGREKRSNTQVAKAAVSLLAIAAGIAGHKHRVNPVTAMNATQALGGVAASLVFLLPNSREMEVEADLIGVELAARAGYDPAGATHLWTKMDSSRRLDFLSTHPSSSSRLNELAPAVAAAERDFSARRIATALRAPAPDRSVDPTAARPSTNGLATAFTCELPGGERESLALLACQRLGGTPREMEEK